MKAPEDASLYYLPQLSSSSDSLDSTSSDETVKTGSPATSIDDDKLPLFEAGEKEESVVRMDVDAFLSECVRMQRALNQVARDIAQMTIFTSTPSSSDPPSALSTLTTSTSNLLLQTTILLRSLSIKAPILRGGGGKAFVSTSETYQVRTELNQSVRMLAMTLQKIKELAEMENGGKEGRRSGMDMGTRDFENSDDAMDDGLSSLVQESNNNPLSHPFTSLSLITADLDLSFLRPSRTVSFEIDSKQSNWINPLTYVRKVSANLSVARFKGYNTPGSQRSAPVDGGDAERGLSEKVDEEGPTTYRSQRNSIMLSVLVFVVVLGGACVGAWMYQREVGDGSAPMPILRDVPRSGGRVRGKMERARLSSDGSETRTEEDSSGSESSGSDKDDQISHTHEMIEDLEDRISSISREARSLAIPPKSFSGRSSSSKSKSGDLKSLAKQITTTVRQIVLVSEGIREITRNVSSPGAPHARSTSGSSMRKTIKLCKDFADTLDDIGEKASEEKKDAGGQGRILALIKSRDSQLDDVGVFEYLKRIERDVGKGLDLATLDVDSIEAIYILHHPFTQIQHSIQKLNSSAHPSQSTGSDRSSSFNAPLQSYTAFRVPKSSKSRSSTSNRFLALGKSTPNATRSGSDSDTQHLIGPGGEPLPYRVPTGDNFIATPQEQIDEMKEQTRSRHIFVPLIILFWFAILVLLIYWGVSRLKGTSSPLGNVDLGSHFGNNAWDDIGSGGKGRPSYLTTGSRARRI